MFRALGALEKELVILQDNFICKCDNFGPLFFYKHSIVPYEGNLPQQTCLNYLLTVSFLLAGASQLLIRHC